jgi:hypothetical protein
LSLELEKKMAPERTAHLKAMEAEVGKLRAALNKDVMAGITKGMEP